MYWYLIRRYDYVGSDEEGAVLRRRHDVVGRVPDPVVEVPPFAGYGHVGHVGDGGARGALQLHRH